MPTKQQISNKAVFALWDSYGWKRGPVFVGRNPSNKVIKYRAGEVEKPLHGGVSGAQIWGTGGEWNSGTTKIPFWWKVDARWLWVVCANNEMRRVRVSLFLLPQHWTGQSCEHPTWKKKKKTDVTFPKSWQRYFTAAKGFTTCYIEIMWSRPFICKSATVYCSLVILCTFLKYHHFHFNAGNGCFTL